jgi:hypothetical protein
VDLDAKFESRKIEFDESFRVNKDDADDVGDDDNIDDDAGNNGIAVESRLIEG